MLRVQLEENKKKNLHLPVYDSGVVGRILDPLPGAGARAVTHVTLMVGRWQTPQAPFPHVLMIY